MSTFARLFQFFVVVHNGPSVWPGGIGEFLCQKGEIWLLDWDKQHQSNQGMCAIWLGHITWSP